MWEPPEHIAALFPDVAGNDINGLGEAAPRAARQIMWANPSTIAHGRVQVHMTEEFVAHPELATVLRMSDRHAPAPVSPTPTPHTPSEWTELLRRRTLEEVAPGAELFGVAAVDPAWFFEGKETGHRNVVMLGFEMDHGELSKAPEPPSAMEVHRQYNRGTRVARELADWIRGHGYEAVGHGGPGAGPLLMIPAALACGFGELGKHGSIINREYGSSFRLACVLTDLPLAPTPPDDFGADDFCRGCRVCAEACPPDAIAHEERLVRGRSKWYVDFDRCMPYFAASYGCGLCIAACPWSTPDAAPRLAENMSRKRQRTD